MTGCMNVDKTTTSGDDGSKAIEVIMNRKSVRSFTGEAIPEEDMTTMLKAAMAAPTGMNRQPWSFVVLTDKESFPTVFEGNFNLRVYQSAGTVVVFCADTTMAGRDANATPVPNRIWRDDMGACTENFLLAAEALGLGAVWTACYPYPDRMIVKERLGLPAEVVPYSIVAVGHPDGDNQPKDKYKPELIHHGKW